MAQTITPTNPMNGGTVTPDGNNQFSAQGTVSELEPGGTADALPIFAYTQYTPQGPMPQATTVAGVRVANVDPNGQGKWKFTLTVPDTPGNNMFIIFVTAASNDGSGPVTTGYNVSVAVRATGQQKQS
jgi:hypothetical protein